jgi:hypothetical protein
VPTPRLVIYVEAPEGVQRRPSFTELVAVKPQERVYLGEMVSFLSLGTYTPAVLNASSGMFTLRTKP